MNYLFSEGLTKYYGEKTLFQNIAIHLNRSQKVALIAKNGTGKTSLLNILAGEETPDEGKIVIHPDIRIGYLKQDVVLDPELTVKEILFQSDSPDMDLIRRYESCLRENQLQPDAKKEAELSSLMEQMDKRGLWDYESRVNEILSRLKIDKPDQKVGSLSGGEKKRVNLAEVLIREPDLYIFDEPTNHLDIEMIEWLEQYLNKPSITLLVVTHDRYFLEKITDEIIELEQGQSFKYKGNYNYYLEKRAERLYQDEREVESARSKLRKEKEWMRRQPKARGTKSKARIDSFYEIEEQASKNLDEAKVSMNIRENRIGGKIILMKSVCKAYDDNVLLDKFTYTFNKGDRIGIVGKNGAGKSTFLNLITEVEKPDAGSVRVGDTVIFGHFKQEGLQLKADQRVIEVIRDVADFIQMEKGVKLTAFQLLEHFLFPKKMHGNYVSTLSGGEKRRLYLLTVLMKNPNFLILDEPTNDLDLMTLNVLEDFLEKFKGVLLIVSHDRYFMDKLVDHLFVFEGDGYIRDFPGHYSHYREFLMKKQKQEAAVEKETKPKPTKSKSPQVKTKLSYNEKREFESLEKEIAQLEIDKVKYEELLASGEENHQKIMEWSTALGKIVGDLDTKSDRWLELSEFVS